MKITAAQLRRLIREAIEDYSEFGIDDNISDTDDAIVQLELDIDAMLNRLIFDLFSGSHEGDPRSFSLADVPKEKLQKAREYFGQVLDLNKDGVYGGKEDWQLSLKNKFEQKNIHGKIKNFINDRTFLKNLAVELDMALNDEYIPAYEESRGKTPEVNSLLAEWAQKDMIKDGTFYRHEDGTYRFSAYNILLVPRAAALWDKNITAQSDIVDIIKYRMQPDKIQFFGGYCCGYSIKAKLELNEDNFRKRKNPYHWHLWFKSIAPDNYAALAESFDISKEDAARVYQGSVDRSARLISKYKPQYQARKIEDARVKSSQQDADMASYARSLQSLPRDRYAKEIDHLMSNLLQIATSVQSQKPEYTNIMRRLQSSLKSLFDNYQTKNVISKYSLDKAIRYSDDLVKHIAILDVEGEVSQDLVKAEQEKQMKLKQQQKAAEVQRQRQLRQQARDLYAVAPGEERQAARSVQTEPVMNTLFDDDLKEQIISDLKTVEARFDELQTSDLRLLRKIILNLRNQDSKKARNQLRALLDNLNDR